MWKDVSAGVNKCISQSVFLEVSGYSVNMFSYLNLYALCCVSV